MFIADEPDMWDATSAGSVVRLDRAACGRAVPMPKQKLLQLHFASSLILHSRSPVCQLSLCQIKPWGPKLSSPKQMPFIQFGLGGSQPWGNLQGYVDLTTCLILPLISHLVRKEY